MIYGEEKNPAYDHLNAEKTMKERNGTQAGDPVKGAQAFYELGVMDDPPLRVVVGTDACAHAPLYSAQHCSTALTPQCHSPLQTSASTRRSRPILRTFPGTRSSATPPMLTSRDAVDGRKNLPERRNLSCMFGTCSLVLFAPGTTSCNKRVANWAPICPLNDPFSQGIASGGLG